MRNCTGFDPVKLIKNLKKIHNEIHQIKMIFRHFWIFHEKQVNQQKQTNVNQIQMEYGTRF